ARVYKYCPSRAFPCKGKAEAPAWKGAAASPPGGTKTAARRKQGGGAVYTVCKGAQALAWEAATAQATVMPTIGLLPAPIRPIISTCAGTLEEPANWASPCIRPMESVRP